jgi:predicted transcriptional regulator
MTTVLSVRIDSDLARRTQKVAKGRLSAFVRDAIVDRLKTLERAKGNPMLAHIEARAGTWDGYVSGEELLRRTRP